ncbi:MAG: DUF2252 family protein [Steroidobacteraceae bacterium]
MQERLTQYPAPDERLVHLLARQNLKMARSAHAYVRGSTLEFYRWLKARRVAAAPVGPRVWICGDCHVGNLGPVASADGSIDIQIRDLDQTVVGNPAHDLVRLALSLATAARGSDLPGVTTAHMLEHMIEGYSRSLSNRRSGAAVQKPDAVRIVMRRAMSRTWKHLAEERLEDVEPNIPLGERYWPLSKRERKAVKSLFAERPVQRLVTALKSRKDDSPIRILDAAYWMKGCSSLGRLRYAVLISVGKGSRPDNFCLIDIKEAVPAAAPRAPGSGMPRDNAQRVVSGARALSPNLGQRMLAARFLNRSVFLRELLPQDLKVEMDQLTREQAVRSAYYLAWVVGVAHARQMDAASRTAWRRMLARQHSKRLSAPSWLWRSVVELVASHELAYLEHCRRYALTQR